MKKIIYFLLLFISVSFCPVSADETKPAGEASHDPMMQAWTKFATPGENHKFLDAFAGKWSHTLKWWTTPGTPAQESKGINENQWIMGGRYLQQNVKGMAMGQPFEGMGIIGYDNVRGEYVSIWIDNMGTGFMTGVGQYDAAAKMMNEKGTYTDPIARKDQPYRGVWKSLDENHSSYEMYMNGKDGKEFKFMEIFYTRVS
jgi:hypothetical protein